MKKSTIQTKTKKDNTDDLKVYIHKKTLQNKVLKKIIENLVGSSPMKEKE